MSAATRHRLALLDLWRHPHMDKGAPWHDGADIVAHLRAGPPELHALAAAFLDAWADRREERPHEAGGWGIGPGSPFGDVEPTPAAARAAAARYRALAAEAMRS